MTKRDDELSPTDMIVRRARLLLGHFEMHRGQLPEPLIKGLTELRDAIRELDKPAAGA